MVVWRFIWIVAPVALFFGAAAIFSAVPVAEAAQTCSCGEATVAQRVASSDAAFIGEPTAINTSVDGPAGLEQLWDLSVERVYVGPTTDKIAIGGGGVLSNCSLDLGSVGRTGIIAHWSAGHLTAGVCGAIDAEVMIAALGEGTLVEPTGYSVLPVALGGAALAVSLALVLMQQQRRRAVRHRD